MTKNKDAKRNQGSPALFMRSRRGYIAALTASSVVVALGVAYIRIATSNQAGGGNQNGISPGPISTISGAFPGTAANPTSSLSPSLVSTLTPTAAPQPSLVPHPSSAPAAATLPSQILNLADWKITLPVAPSGSSDAEEITQPQLAEFSLPPYFAVDSTHDGVAFQADAGGATTSGSGYPRSELREMTDNGTQEASWSIAAPGTNVMSVTEASTILPKVKPQVVTAQIHDSSGDIIEILADGERSNSPGTYSICVRYNGAEQKTCLDDHYVPGTRYTIQMSASAGHILIDYDGVQKFDFSNTAAGCYFKAGAYTQSSVSKGDAPTAYGQVIIYSLRVEHSG